MTAHTPPTPPAIRERKLESVCFEASTTSVLTSPADGIEGADDEDEDEDIACGKKQREKERGKKREREIKRVARRVIRSPLFYFTSLSELQWDGIVKLGFGPTAEAHEDPWHLLLGIT